MENKRFGPFLLDFTITIPDLIAILGSFAALMLAWSALTARLDIHDVLIKQHDKELVDLRKADENQRIEIRGDLQAINNKLDRLIERETVRR